MSERPWARLVDRRGDARGDARRTALLAALDDLLRDQALDRINVAEISRAAGVTRSAFYFYFESKAMAVMALMSDLYDAASITTEQLIDARGDADERVRSVLTRLFDSVDASPHTYRALLEARGTSATVREMWDAGLADFAGEVATMIGKERAAGRATDGPDAAALAAVLLDLNNHALERHALGSGPPRQEHIDALTAIWVCTIYGSVEPSAESSSQPSTSPDGSTP